FAGEGESMTQNPDYPDPCETSNSLPGWVASGALGLAIGAAAAILGMHGYGYRLPQAGGGEPAVQNANAGEVPVPGMPPGGIAPPSPMMGMGGMGGMGGGFGGGGKRNLTSLVGKLELLSRPSLDLHVELDPEQARKIALKLEELEKAGKMTGDEAQAHLESLEDLLTADQKDTLGLIGLPFARPGGGAAGRPGGGPPMMGMGMMGG